MHSYNIYNEETLDFFKTSWFAPENIEDIYSENKQNPIFTAENDYIDAAILFIKEAGISLFTVEESEIYNEYYGISAMKKSYPDKYPDKMLDLLGSLSENKELPTADAEYILRLMFRGHIWATLNFDDKLKIFFKRPGILTVLTTQNHPFAVKNIENLQIDDKDLQ